ncbi:MAG: c-type cytochrome [Thiohalomonadales bacterium]
MTTVTRLIYVVCFTLLITSCNDSSNDTQSVAKPNVSSGSEALTLAKKSGCLACHNLEKKLVGPSWHAVSERYLGNTDVYPALIDKVKNGGKGNWTDITQSAPMPPYSPRVSDENINKLVTFILGIAATDSGVEYPIPLSVNGIPMTFEFIQGEQPSYYFTASIRSNMLYKVEITMINGIADMSIERPDNQGNSIVVNEMSGIDGQLSYEFLPSEDFYDLNITAKTDVIFTLTVSTSETSFLALAKASGCLACHGLSQNIVGPAWLDISNRYREDVNAETMLIEKVKKGGKGNWTIVTGGAPMPPYSPRVSDQNIAILIQEILQLR